MSSSHIPTASGRGHCERCCRQQDEPCDGSCGAGCFTWEDCPGKCTDRTGAEIDFSGIDWQPFSEDITGKSNVFNDEPVTGTLYVYDIKFCSKVACSGTVGDAEGCGCRVGSFKFRVNSPHPDQPDPMYGCGTIQMQASNLGISFVAEEYYSAGGGNGAPVFDLKPTFWKNLTNLFATPPKCETHVVEGSTSESHYALGSIKVSPSCCDAEPPDALCCRQYIKVAQRRGRSRTLFGFTDSNGDFWPMPESWDDADKYAVLHSWAQSHGYSTAYSRRYPAEYLLECIPFIDGEYGVHIVSLLYARLRYTRAGLTMYDLETVPAPKIVCESTCYRRAGCKWVLARYRYSITINVCPPPSCTVEAFGTQITLTGCDGEWHFPDSVEPILLRRYNTHRDWVYNPDIGLWVIDCNSPVVSSYETYILPDRASVVYEPGAVYAQVPGLRALIDAPALGVCTPCSNDEANSEESFTNPDVDCETFSSYSVGAYISSVTVTPCGPCASSSLPLPPVPQP